MENLIGTRYAQALFGAGQDENSLDSLYNDIILVEQMFRENEDFFKVLCVPTISKSEKNQLLDTVFQGNIQNLTLNFLHIMVDHSRFSALFAAAQKFVSLYREEKGIYCVTAVTAVPLRQELVQRLTDKLTAITGKQIELTCKVDPSIISGVRLQMHGEQLDGSVRGRLEEISRLLQGAVVG